MPTVSCPTCGSETPSGARFCPTCGNLLVETEQRRVVTVLFADLVGFTALGEDADPEDLKHLIDNCFQRMVADITAFGGTVDKIIGDAILAIFGAPTAHEDDPERALRAAFRMHRTLADFSQEGGIELRMRIGVNTGEVVVGALQAGGDYTVMGNTVNVASRLQEMAAPGEVLVGAITQAATSSVVQYEGRGEIKLKGLSEPVGVFSAFGDLAPPGRRTSQRAPLVGRRFEIQQLTAAIDTAVVRRRAQLLQIVGEAGLGKRRLAQEIAKEVDAEHGAVVLSSMVQPYDEANPLRALGDATVSTAGVTHDLSNDEASDRIAEMVSQTLSPGPGEPGTAEHRRKVSEITELLLEMLGRSPGALTSASSTAPMTTATTLDLDDRLGKVAALMIELYTALLRRHPVMLQVGDVHWADKRLLSLLESLLRALATQPFVVLTTARWSVDDKRWTVPTGRHNVVVLNLDPLSASATAELANHLLGYEAPTELVEQLHARSGGNPFFIEEITTLLREEGVTATHLSSDQLDRPLADLPGTLRGLVAARLDGLTDDERTMVDAAAVLGSGTTEDLLSLAMLSEPTFRQLVDKDIFATDERTWGFRSDLVREVAYARLTRNDRVERHIGVAEWLAEGIEERSPEYVLQVADHLATAVELGANTEVGMPLASQPASNLSDAAIDWLGRAGESAVERESHHAADQLYRRAIELLSSDDPRVVKMALGRSQARLNLGEISGALADAQTARSLAEMNSDRLGTAHGLRQLGRISLASDEPTKAESLLTESLGQFQALGEVREAAEALGLRGFALLRMGDHARADRFINEAYATFMHLGDKTGAAWCLQSLAWLSFEQGLIDEADERLQAAITTFTEEGDTVNLATARGLLAFLLFHAGNRPEAEEMARDVHKIVKERGERFTEAMMELLLGSIEMWSGQASEALSRATNAEKVFNQVGSAFGVVQALGLQGRAYAALGELQRSRAVLEECLQRAMSMPGKPLERFAQAVRAGGNVQVGNPVEALEDIKRASQTTDVNAPLVIGTLELGVSEGLALLQLGEPDEALEVLESATKHSDEKAPSMYLESSLALGYCTVGMTKRAIERAQDVLDDGSGTYLDVRTALLAQALSYAREADRAAMDTALNRALASIDETDSRLSQAIVRLAQALCHKALRTERQDELAETAEVAFRSLDTRPTGWETAFSMALGLEVPQSPSGPLPDPVPYSGNL